MKGLMSRRPSPALVVAVVALVVAMFGTAYAATQLPKNSVGTKQLKANAVTTAKVKKNAITTAKIKKNAVTGAKVKNQSLTGADINLSTLGTVPSAQIANSLVAPEAIHLVGAPGEPPFENGGKNIPGEGGINFAPAGFYKDHDGVVHLEGVVESGEELPVVFKLPPGFRPASGITQIFEGGGTGVLIFGDNVNLSGLDLSGAVLVEGSGAILSGVTFRAQS